jgi:hypothetical protein
MWLHVDEPGWRVDGVNHWLWVFVNDAVALYLVSASRGRKVPKAILGADFGGTVISDFFSAYSPLPVTKATCWAHLLRDSHDLPQWAPAGDERHRFHERLHGLFLAMGLAVAEVAADETARAEVRRAMRADLATFTRGPWDQADCQRLANRISNTLDDVTVWLADPAVAPTNPPQADRRARAPASGGHPQDLIRQPVQGGGAHAFAGVLSLVEPGSAKAASSSTPPIRCSPPHSAKQVPVG